MKTGVIIVIIILILGGIIAYTLISKTYNNANFGNQDAVTGTEVQIQTFAFNPSSLKIKTGDTVIWTNKDNTLHTITSNSGTELNSGNLDKGQIYSYKFTTAGTYEYHCTYHPSMKAKIIVE